MQEEVDQRVVVMIENCSRLTASELRRALEKVLADIRAARSQKLPKQEIEAHGRMTVKELAKQGKGMQSIEVSDSTIGAFNRVARKYGIDFAPFKVKGENRYLVFFKAPDTDAMTAAFSEYTQRQVRKASRPSILKKLEHFKSLIQHPKKEKTRYKEPER